MKRSASKAFKEINIYEFVGLKKWGYLTQITFDERN